MGKKKKAPPLPEHLREAWEGFRRLSQQRQEGFSGFQPIAYSDIILYLNEYSSRIPKKLRRAYIAIIQALDQTFLRIHREKIVK